MPLHLLLYLFYLESGTYSGYVSGLSEVKVGRKKDPLNSRTKYFEFTLQSKSKEKHVLCFFGFLYKFDIPWKMHCVIFGLIYLWPFFLVIFYYQMYKGRFCLTVSTHRFDIFSHLNDINSEINRMKMKINQNEIELNFHCISFTLQLHDTSMFWNFLAMKNKRIWVKGKRKLDLIKWRN